MSSVTRSEDADRSISVITSRRSRILPVDDRFVSVVICVRLRVPVGVGQLVESLLSVVAVLGESHVDPPSVEPDCVDGAAGLDEEIDRVGKFVLASVGGLDEVTRVEDGGRERVEAGHHEVARRVVRLLDDFRDLAVLVGVEDAVARRLLVGDLLDEERGVGAIFFLATRDVAEVPAEDVVAEHEHEVAVDVGLCLEDGVRQAELLALVGVGDRHVAILVAVAIDDLFGLVADDDDQLRRARVDQVVENVLDEGCAVDLDEDLRLVVR